jgi:TatD DNase family protein
LLPPRIYSFERSSLTVNLTDPVFRGQYRGRRKHDGRFKLIPSCGKVHNLWSADDFAQMLGRAKRAGVMSMIITGGSLSESKLALNLAKEHGMCQTSPIPSQGQKFGRNILDLYATVGCHPTRSTEFDNDPTRYLAALDELVNTNISGPGRAVAVGECGLDYDRIHFASAAVQQHAFRMCDRDFVFTFIVLLMLRSTGFQLTLAKKYRLPLFLHSRAAHEDLVQILREEGFGEDGGRAVGGRGGVVHSFTGSAEEAADYVRVRVSILGLISTEQPKIKMGFYIRFVLQLACLLC